MPALVVNGVREPKQNSRNDAPLFGTVAICFLSIVSVTGLARFTEVKSTSAVSGETSW